MSRHTIIFICSIILLGCSIIASLMIGQLPVTWSQLIGALFHYDSHNEVHTLIRTTRASRTIIAMLVGASLSVAGLLMQVLMKNPIASPGLFGVNGGAIFTIVLLLTFFSVKSLESLIVFGTLGALLAMAIVMVLSMFKQTRFSANRIILAGAAIAALFSAFTQGLLIIDESNLQSILFWLTGSVAVRNFFDVMWIIPLIVITLIVIFAMHRSIQLLWVNEELAAGLGVNLMMTKMILILCASILAGVSTSMAGNIMFVGLIIPNIAKSLMPQRYSLIIPLTAILGSSLMLLSDIVARTIFMPQEIPVGIITSIIGAVMLMMLMRKDRSMNESR